MASSKSICSYTGAESALDSDRPKTFSSSKSSKASLSSDVFKRVDDFATSTKPSTAKCGATPKKAAEKKSEKLKYEIDRQNYAVELLNQELRVKTEQGFPEDCLRALKKELCAEKKKLKTMTDHDCVEKERRCKSDEGWETICFDELSSSDECKNRNKPPGTPPGISKCSGFTDMQFSDELVTENERLESDRFALQEKLLSKNESLQDLEVKLEKMQCHLIKICHENKTMAEKLAKAHNRSDNDGQSDIKEKVQAYIDNANCLTEGIHELESQLKKLRLEVDSVKREKEVADELVTSSYKSNTVEHQAEMKLKCLQSQYANLQFEFCRKQQECMDMAERMQKSLDKGAGDEDGVVNKALKKRADEFESEIASNKVFIRELQEQVCTYQQKFLKAQETVERQRYMLENLELSNKEVEGQINEEISRIKEKFQQKLSELCPYPKLYEDSRVELVEMKERVAGLEADLKSTIAALCKANRELKKLKENPDDSLEKKYKKLQHEVEMLTNKYGDLKTTKECLEEKLSSMKKDLEDLRKDSSKIIATTKCCAEKNRQILHQHINCLEIDLAKCRASASMSLSEKEEVIKKMKQELSLLCGHFNDCQAQIKHLKNQVMHLTNQRYNIRPEDLSASGCCSQEF